MRLKVRGFSGWVVVFSAALFLTVSSMAPGDCIASQTDSSASATIAVLSHTDFLPDATGVYDRRSWHGRDKNPNFAANNDLRTGSDQAYDKVTTKHGYAPEAVGLPEILADAILEQLAKSKRFLPVDRKALRTTVLEQRFGKQITESYLDRTLDQAMQDFDKLEIGGGLAMQPVISGAKYNDLLHDFKDLGNSVGARYLVLGNLHQLGSAIEKQKIPHSESNRSIAQKTAEARLRLRVIDSSTSKVIGADSLNMKVSSMLFEGGKESRDDFEFMNQVAKDAANKILDLIFPAKIVSLEPIVVSRGSNDGVMQDDHFTVVREGKEIKESSGEVIARLKTPVGSVKVVSLQETVSIVVPVQGGDFQKGDLAVQDIPQSEVVEQESTALTKKVDTGGEKGLPRVAVGLVKTGSTAKTGPNAGKHSPAFTDTIISRLVQSKRFTVIDRQEVDQLLDEQMAQALVANRNMPSAMGTLKGCDYLIIGSLQNLSKEEQAIRLPNSSRVMKVLDGFVEGNMRIVDAHSGDILESRKISIQKQLDNQAGEERLIAALADGYAAEVVARLLNAIYPVKVAAVTGDSKVYVNRGTDGLLEQGALYDVLRPGMEIKDPDTGVVLGVEEIRVGQVELQTVEENRSLAFLVEGTGAQTGDLLKAVEPAIEKSGMKKTGGTLPGNQPRGQDQSQALSKQGGGKATVALMKITLNARKTFKDPEKISAIQQGTVDQITDNLVDALDKTNRFAMMERREIDQVLDEKTFMAVSQGQDIREGLKELEGADYVVVGELTNFYLLISKKKVPYLNTTEVNLTGFIEGNHRIVDSHTSRVIATEKVRVKQKFKNMGVEEIRTKLIDRFALEAADAIVRRIYPMKILGVLPDGTIFINRGADSDLKVGSTFTVERPGELLVDLDTNISFGTAEVTVGELQITAVEEVRSRAQMISGETPAIGDILRNEVAQVKTPEPLKLKVNW